jgi:ERCC4-type nuclease
MTIFVDYRKGSKDLVDIYPLDKPGLCELCKLDSGDVMFSGYNPTGEVLIGIELKELGELISSIQTGRLQAGQMPKMINDYDTKWLLYYGNYRPSEKGYLQTVELGNGDTVKRKKWKDYGYSNNPIRYSYLEDFLIESREYGFKIQRVGSKCEAAMWIYIYYKLISRPWSSHKLFKTFDRSGQIPFPPEMKLSDQERRMARVADELCPGIGFERAIAAARYFDSVQHMVNADVSEWQSIDGIGKVIAKRVRAAIEGE